MSMTPISPPAILTDPYVRLPNPPASPPTNTYIILAMTLLREVTNDHGKGLFD